MSKTLFYRACFLVHRLISLPIRFIIHTIGRLPQIRFDRRLRTKEWYGKMKTKIIEIEYPQKPRDEELLEGARILREGGLVAFPTETVYGLGANALDEEAARKIYEAKGRPSDNPLIAHVSSMECIWMEN